MYIKEQILTVSPLKSRDEISRFISTRTFDAHDAHWRTTEYKIQDRFPALFNPAIPIHSQHNIVFREGHALEALARAKDTILQGFFKLNRSNSEVKKYLCIEILEQYTWNENKQTMTIRVGQRKERFPG